eukprot:Selendium_serpulae@DN4967_c0_g1_i1.p1
MVSLEAASGDVSRVKQLESEVQRLSDELFSANQALKDDRHPVQLSIENRASVSSKMFSRENGSFYFDHRRGCTWASGYSAARNRPPWHFSQLCAQPQTDECARLKKLLHCAVAVNAARQKQISDLLSSTDGQPQLEHAGQNSGLIVVVLPVIFLALTVDSLFNNSGLAMVVTLLLQLSCQILWNSLGWTARFLGSLAVAYFRVMYMGFMCSLTVVLEFISLHSGMVINLNELGTILMNAITP